MGESRAAFYLERAGKQLFILEFPVFNYLTSYPFFKIRTDLELVARYNDVSIAGACPPYSLCSIDVSNRAFEFDKAFVHYLSMLPEYRAARAFTFECTPVSESRSRILDGEAPLKLRAHLVVVSLCSLEVPSMNAHRMVVPTVPR